MSSDADPADPPRPALDGTLSLRAQDTGAAWTLSDGEQPGAVRLTTGTAHGPTLEATGSDLLLWLYGRVDLDTVAGAGRPAGPVPRAHVHRLT